MAFDAYMLSASLSEIRSFCLGARVEKVYQPERDEIVLQIRSISGGKRLLINAGTSNPRIGFTATQKENPQNPPMFCMLLRKHLQGSKLFEVSMASFDRIAYLGFETRDALGFPCKKYLIAELMGRYSNLIFADQDKKIITALRTSDLSLDSKRQLISGMTYREPGVGDKRDPTEISREEFSLLYASAPAERRADKFLVEVFCGMSPTLAREIVFRATRHTDTPISYCSCEEIWGALCEVNRILSEEQFSPTLVVEMQSPVEYSFLPLYQYGESALRTESGIGELLDVFYETRDNENRVRQRASDIAKLVNNAEARIQRKLELQRGELLDCERGAEYKRIGDLITANIYRLSQRDRFAEFDDYENMLDDGSFAKIRIELDTRITPAANAQRYYKKYSKAKNARIELSKQIKLGEEELLYIATVKEALSRAESPQDLLEIREELYKSGYASRMKTFSQRKAHTPTVMTFITPDGARVLCGKNNIQNEHITFKLAKKQDYWFHAKQMAGSHVLLVTEDKEPTDLDFTLAAEIAAYYSKAEGDNIAVDYTLAKNVKKPAGSRTGFVIYHTNWTAYVTPDPDRIAAMRKRS